MSTEAGKEDAAFYAPAEQELPRSQLDQRRDTQLAALLAEAARSTSTFYAKRLRTPARILAEIPPLTGADLAAEITAHPPFGRLQLRPQPLIRAGLASSGVPAPIPICWSQADLELEADLGSRMLWRAGLRPRARASDTLEGGLVTPGTLAIADTLDRLDALALPVGPITTPAALGRAREVWDIVRPHALILDAPSFRFLDDNGGIAVAARVVVLTPDQQDVLVAPPRADVYRVLSLPIVSTFLAGECAAHDGFHLPEDVIVAEIVDGMLVVTTLARSAAIIRLNTGLRASLDRSVCRCGETHARVRLP